jgi:sugar/nucleoside kinase (ribokinase family)
MLDICCIGHITLDKVVTPANTKHMPGGTAYYFANALQHINVKLGLLTAVGDTELHEVERLKQQGTTVTAVPSQSSVYFENTYSSDQDHRTQRVLQKASPFTVADLDGIEAAIYHLGPLLADDIPVELIAHAADKGKVSLDAQGYLREVRDQKVHAIDWPEKIEALKHISILKVNEHESKALTGITDIRAGALQLAEWGVAEVVVTLGSKGSVILSEGKFYEIPAYKPPVINDATGCGDTYMAGYLYKRAKGADIEEAGNFAAAMAGIKIGGFGPFTGTEDEVKAFMAN